MSKAKWVERDGEAELRLSHKVSVRVKANHGITTTYSAELVVGYMIMPLSLLNRRGLRPSHRSAALARARANAKRVIAELQSASERL